MNKIEIKHALSTYRRAVKDLEKIADYSNFLLNDSIPYDSARHLIEKKLTHAMANVMAASEYLWIQTGISLPKEIPDEFLASKLNEYAADLDIEHARNEEGVRAFNEMLDELCID